MMINLLLIFPILACLIMFIFKAKWMNNFMINVYALMHLVVSIACAMNLPCISSKYFCADSSNIVFLLLLSIVFMAVAIYNSGYIKHETTDVRRLKTLFIYDFNFRPFNDRRDFKRKPRAFVGFY